jgi:co-chaperonin GroES (HSP10)
MNKASIKEVMDEMVAYGDRVLVLEDEYSSGRECTKCQGKGHLGEICKWCQGTGYYKANPESGNKCPDCLIGSGPLTKSLGFVPCDLCKGQGTSSIIIPEEAEKRPTTGVICSVGAMVGWFRVGGEWTHIPESESVRVGDRILYTNFSGNQYEIKVGGNKYSVRILKELEILCKVLKTPKGTPEAREFTELAEVGIKSTND